MAETFTSTFLNNFLLIFVAIDPFALIPIFAGISHGLKKNEIKRIYLRATIISFIILFVGNNNWLLFNSELILSFILL